MNDIDTTLSDGEKRAILSAASDAYEKLRWAHAWIVAYGCRFCGGHHIGHPPRNVRQAIKARRERNGS